LIKHARGDTPWDVEVNANYDTTDSELARPRIPHNSPTVGPTTTCDLSLARAFKFTVSQATTLAFTNVPANTFFVWCDLKITNGNAFTLTFPASVTWLQGVLPTFQTSGEDHVRMYTVDGGTTWFARHVGKNLTITGVLRGGLGNSTTQSKPTLVRVNGNATTTATVEGSLFATTLPANTLAVADQLIRLKIYGNAVAQAAQLRVKFGASYVLNIAGGNNITAGNVYEAEVVIRRTGAATEVSIGRLLQGTAVVALERATPAETLSGDITVDVRGNTAVGGGTLNVDVYTFEYLAV
jgi:hypothetical protein